jgi:hypothetical protein
MRKSGSFGHGAFLADGPFAAPRWAQVRSEGYNVGSTYHYNLKKYVCELIVHFVQRLASMVNCLQDKRRKVAHLAGWNNDVQQYENSKADDMR